MKSIDKDKSLIFAHGQPIGCINCKLNGVAPFLNHLLLGLQMVRIEQVKYLVPILLSVDFIENREFHFPSDFQICENMPVNGFSI